MPRRVNVMGCSSSVSSTSTSFSSAFSLSLFLSLPLCLCLSQSFLSETTLSFFCRCLSLSLCLSLSVSDSLAIDLMIFGVGIRGPGAIQHLNRPRTDNLKKIGRHHHKCMSPLGRVFLSGISQNHHIDIIILF